LFRHMKMMLTGVNEKIICLWRTGGEGLRNGGSPLKTKNSFGLPTECC
jgi:hypothetical protein